MRKKNVLKKNWQFQDVIKENKQLVSKNLILYYRASLKPLRIGISIPKKFLNAVGRNYNRRQIRSVITDLNPFEKFFYDTVLIVRKPFLKLSFLQKKASIQTILKNLEGINGKKKSQKKQKPKAKAN